MRDLIPSSRFAQLSRLSRKALRLYAEQGLLRPAHIDPGSGYHTYSLSQLEDARRISDLRALGMPLAAIRDALRVWNTPALGLHLAAHRDALHAQAQQVQAALEGLDALIARPAQPYAVQTKTVAPQRYLGTRGWCAPDSACAVIAQAQARLEEARHRHLLDRGGAALAIYHDEREDAWDIEVCLPLGDGWPVDAWPGGIYHAELPGGEVAYTVHTGDCGGNHGMQGAYTAVWHWLTQQGREPLGGPHEVYLFDETNTADPADYRTEVAWRLRP
ncbi:MerR family transcriptional regulator [uncultured Deinococcus sp.]|uniref:MerR family transcriptional regulator n=1 Tax=uncultured Deinococcus sp. TaxID=158789 RepID=UPI0025F0D766|nr:MerR family transcriptional regulator [uncultured Deinococcus sp.]